MDETLYVYVGILLLEIMLIKQHDKHFNVKNKYIQNIFQQFS